MAENKTKATEASVESYLSTIEDEARRKDCEALAKLMTKATKQQPKMWGTSIVGFVRHRLVFLDGKPGKRGCCTRGARRPEGMDLLRACGVSRTSQYHSSAATIPIGART